MLHQQLTRREYLKQSAYGFAGLMLSSLPALNVFGQEKRAGKLTIRSVKPVVLAERIILVQVTTDQGITGWGESSAMGAKELVPLIHSLNEIVVGEDPRDIEKLWEKLLVRTYKLEGRAICIAISGVDIALWDIIGKAAGMSVTQLLGGYYRDRIPFYATLDRDISPQNMARRAAAAKEAGFKSVKLKVATRWGFDAQPDNSVETVAAVRQAVGKDIKIVVDSNSGWSVPTAIRMCRAIEQYDIAWLEQPVPERDLASVAAVTKATDIPVGFGEEEWNLWRFKEVLVNEVADIMQADPIKCVGLTGTKKVAILTEAFSKTLTPHNTSATIGMAATAAIVASTPNARAEQECTILEDAIKQRDNARKVDFLAAEEAPPNVRDVRRHLFQEPFRIEGSSMPAMRGVGLGVKLNPEIVRKHANVTVDAAAFN
ncbi:MAG TPA: mandelate racemase/muconate lactonizing enzyme family protein [Blastocatellia bacterium]|nr:mandelate racemase/muconate lactonizing enzyme family protein [Blastocatellia bacterium]